MGSIRRSFYVVWEKVSRAEGKVQLTYKKGLNTVVRNIWPRHVSILAEQETKTPKELRLGPSVHGCPVPTQEKVAASK